MMKAIESQSSRRVSREAASFKAVSFKPASFKRGRLLGGDLGRRLREDRGGAALVEFALAIMPFLCLFFGMMQWTLCAYANLIVQHAAYVAARAEAVMLPAMPDNADATGTAKDLEGAVSPLFIHVPGFLSLVSLVDGLSVKLVAQPANTCDQTISTVQVNYTMQCTIPLGNSIACPSPILGSILGIYTQKLTATASFPNQGSYYQSVWGSTIGGKAACQAVTGS